MTQEDKQLLLKDLCARLPYGVKFQGEDSNVYTLDAANYFALQVEDMVFKPYLRTMTTMTDEENKEFWKVVDNYGSDSNAFDDGFELGDDVDWLNEHHFDYRGLIEKGLALESPEGMYKIKEENE